MPYSSENVQDILHQGYGNVCATMPSLSLQPAYKAVGGVLEKFSFLTENNALYIWNMCFLNA